MDIIKFKDIWEMYRIKFIFDGKPVWENFWALKDINFSVAKAECVGIIGENGAGKSTILKLIAGMLKPDRGDIEILGKVSGLLELGAGFQPELTGKDNIYLSASLFGLNHQETEAKRQNIIEFAELGKFINAPVKCYSQGMFVRLAFAIAIHMNPEILVIDDTLSVGDEYFQKKCLSKIFELKEEGITIVCVTHDMGLLKRLCRRALFLKEGRIIKDDFISKVVPLYSQMTGVREGVGVLNKKPLTLVFNNGKMFISWKDNLITSHFGIYLIFGVNAKWYGSQEANWVVDSSQEDKLSLRGNFYRLGITQIWEVKIADDFTVNLEIKIEAQQTCCFEECYLNMMVSSEYNRWYTCQDKGVFDEINQQDKNWQAFIQGNNFTPSLIVSAPEEKKDKLPSLALEISQPFVGFGQIFNSDYLNNCRVLQYRLDKPADSCGNKTGYFYYFSGKIIIGIDNIDDYAAGLPGTASLSKGEFKLSLIGGRGLVSYAGKQLIKDKEHIITCFCAHGRWYDSAAAQWIIKKEGKNKLVAQGNWPGLALTQVWEIETKGNGAFSWKVKMIVQQEIEISEQSISFPCLPEYEAYYNDYINGYFPEEFHEGEVDMFQRCIGPGTIGLINAAGLLPMLFLNFSKKLNNFAKIFNSDCLRKTRLLRIYKMENKDDSWFVPGEYDCFELEVGIDWNKPLSLDNSANIAVSQGVKYNFDRGRGRLYWHDLELTKHLSFYTAMRSNGRWYNSYSGAGWEILDCSSTILNAQGKWFSLPIRQFWRFMVKENNVMDIEIKMFVDEALRFDRLQTNLMLTQRYTGWRAAESNGKFPMFKTDIDDDWDVLWARGYFIDKQTPIAVNKGGSNESNLPMIKFLPYNFAGQGCLNILNSDVYHNGRVLQYLNKEDSILVSGEYVYFRGAIIIEENT